MRKQTNFNFGLDGRPAGPPTQKEYNRFGIEEAWLRWSFFFGDVPEGKRVWLNLHAFPKTGYAAMPEVGLCMALRRKSDVASKRQSSSSGVLAAGPLKGLPELWDFLTKTSFPDGSKRKTGSLSLKLDAGQFTLSLNEHETKEFCSLTGTDLQLLLETAELQMAADELRWRPSKY